ncbi:VLRF1 family aeRF1-type release factor [Halalkalibacter sp. AB-rgal2]|uniref:VLRF1 family aeRF1-type release factor n=1 Tax=Halalkalibacter sp. AB-rgal2 TaxID=3242695 RepID=UPI00359D3E5D
MDIQKEIEKLEKIYLEKSNKILTMYLNTDRSDPDQQGGEWKIHLKNGLRNFESYLNEVDNEEEKRNYSIVRKKIERYMKENEQSLARSVIIFATADQSVWFAEKFQMPVQTEFEWKEVANTSQLRELHQTFPKTGVILTQKEQVKVLDAELGSLKQSHHFQLDLDTEDWREYLGPHESRATVGSGGKSTQQEKFRERFEANRYRWYKSLASTLDRLAKHAGWQNIYVVGDKEETNDLLNHMNKAITDVIHKNMLNHKEKQVLHEVVL